MAFRTLLLPGLVVGLVLGLAAWLFSRRFGVKGGAAVTDAMLQGLLLLLAFVVGLTLSSETGTLGSAQSAASSEANGLAELYWFAHGVHQPEHGKLQVLLKNYATIVARDEWPLLAHHKSSPLASAAVRAIRDNLIHYTPHTAKEMIFYPTALTDVTALFNFRRSRVAIAISPGVPNVLLDALIFLTALVLVALPLSGELKGGRELALYGLFAALFVAAMLFVIDLNNPFAGGVMVGPDDFQNLFKSTFLHVT